MSAFQLVCWDGCMCQFKRGHGKPVMRPTSCHDSTAPYCTPKRADAHLPHHDSFTSTSRDDKCYRRTQMHSSSEEAQVVLIAIIIVLLLPLARMKTIKGEHVDLTRRAYSARMVVGRVGFVTVSAFVNHKSSHVQNMGVRYDSDHGDLITVDDSNVTKTKHEVSAKYGTLSGIEPA